MLSDLCGNPQADSFFAWRGVSDKRYVVSVYPIGTGQLGTGQLDAGLPDFEAFVLVSVKRGGPVRRPLTIVAIERRSDRPHAIAEALSLGADEWHVHLLAETRRERAVVVRDLRSRHVTGAAMLLSA